MKLSNKIYEIYDMIHFMEIYVKYKNYNFVKLSHIVTLSRIPGKCWSGTFPSIPYNLY